MEKFDQENLVTHLLFHRLINTMWTFEIILAPKFVGKSKVLRALRVTQNQAVNILYRNCPAFQNRINVVLKYLVPIKQKSRF